MNFFLIWMHVINFSCIYVVTINFHSLAVDIDLFPHVSMLKNLQLSRLLHRLLIIGNEIVIGRCCCWCCRRRRVHSTLCLWARRPAHRTRRLLHFASFWRARWFHCLFMFPFCVALWKKRLTSFPSFNTLPLQSNRHHVPPLLDAVHAGLGQCTFGACLQSSQTRRHHSPTALWLGRNRQMRL